MLVILSGVAGAGKDTIKKELIKRMDNVESLPSYTSRPPRPGDVEGQTYCFVSKEEFEKMIEENAFYEYDIHHNNYYGVPREELKRRLKERVDKPTPEEIMLRLNRFDYEESKIGLYDYVIKNNDLEKTVQIIMAIIKNEASLENPEF